ncbi:MAG: hypothetical protein CML29_08545 [Rhizobiales bacterium]|nr:hypothetical protein [Hyphomicrobiales bacterium]MBA68913.1 hypothetical protein [Hyphomicrobiales bacterium]|tara:strand:- start:4233 stop:5018 length:786 start_codon:yes stop_codon:yes gene_type:complete
MSGLFDSLSHPTLTGQWFARDLDATWPTLVKGMREGGFSRACAVGLAGVEGYEHEAFVEACRPHPELVPIAGIDPRGDLASELRRVKDLGFAGIKLHPRLSGFTLGDDCLADAFRAAREVDLPVFLCTYCHGPVERAPLEDPLYGLARALRAVPDVRLLLLHGGDVELMRYMQLVRHSPNILIDLSFTMMKYPGSSLDLDLAYLMRGFNRRTCFGVDHPEYTHADVRARFDELSAGLSAEERENVGFRNLARFLRLPEQLP